MQNQTRFREAINDDHPYTPAGHPPSYQPWPEPPSPNSPISNIDTIDTMAHSPSSKQRPMSPELLSPGLESVWGDEGGKEVVMHHEVEPLPPDPLAERKPERICGFKKSSFYWMLAAIILVIIALAVGLGAGLGLKHHPSGSASKSSSSSEYNIGGSLDPAYYSMEGAFNGSGIALASQSFDASDHGELVLYFQHRSGQIRYKQLNPDGVWAGGDSSTIVATNAKNGTPISAVSYSLQGSSTWHVFFIDKDNHLRQRTNSNTSNLWLDGPINQLNLSAYDADQVGMQSCWYGSDYGDVDYLHSPLPDSGEISNATVAAHSEVGMHMWYATNETTIQQYGWRAGDKDWTQQDTWTGKDGHAGIGCYSWQPNSTVTYVMMVNTENTVEFWWKDTNSTNSNTTTHPINKWTNTSIAIPNVHPSTSLGYTNLFYAQDDATDNIIGYNISWAAEGTTIVQDDTTEIPIAPGLPGTHFSVSALPEIGGGNSLVVFYQTKGDDITQFSRPLEGGQWTTVPLTIQNE